MFTIHRTTSWILTAIAAVVWAQSGRAAEEFRIETHIYVDDQAEPAAKTVTLFERGAVYDFTDDPQQVVIYRGGAAGHPGQFILLDPKRKLRTEVTTDRIETLMEKVALWSVEQQDPVLRFSAQPKFTIDYNEQSGALTLSSDVWTYRVATAVAERPSALIRYREFIDWYARLNSMLHSTPPPGPRLELNRELAERGLIPVEIQRTIGSGDAAVRAAHLFSWRLSRDDRARLDQAQKQLASFESVDNVTFMAGDER